MINQASFTEKELDLEWLELMKQAEEQGLTVQEIKSFLAECRQKALS